METPLFALEIFSGTCCLLSSVFLHFFSYSAKQKDLIYQKGLMYIKLALIIMGVSTLFFAITESFRLPNAKSYFIQSICNRLLLNILQVISQKYGLNL